MKKILAQFLSWWKKILAPIGIIQGRLLFLVIYLGLFLPIGLISSIFSDPLNLKLQKPVWRKRTDNYDNLKSAMRQ